MRTTATLALALSLAAALTTGCGETAAASCVEAFEKEVPEGWSFACVEVDAGETATVILPSEEGDFLMVPIGGEEPPSFWATCPPRASSTLCVDEVAKGWVHLSYGKLLVEPPEGFEEGYACLSTHTY